MTGYLRGCDDARLHLPATTATMNLALVSARAVANRGVPRIETRCRHGVRDDDPALVEGRETPWR